MTQSNLPQGLLPALTPSASSTQFPVPRLVTGEGSAGVSQSESLLLNGVQMPGQWLLVEATREFGWEVRKGWGLTGATVIPVGDGLVTLKFDIKIWNNLDAKIYNNLLKTTLKKPAGILPGSTSTAGMGCDQPQAKSLGVTSVVVKSITPLLNPLVGSGGKGAWTARCELLEYRKPIAAIATPSTTFPDQGTPNPSAKDNLDKEIQAAGQQAQQAATNLAQALSGGPKP